MQLFKEHLGLVNTSVSKAFNYEQRQNIAVMDPLDDGFYYNVWKRTAERNTSIYRELFKCVPDDTGKFPLLILMTPKFKNMYTFKSSFSGAASAFCAGLDSCITGTCSGALEILC